MDSQSLTTAQLDQVFAVVHKQLDYLSRLWKRVEQTGFPHDDRFRQAATKAQVAMQNLAMQTHYLAMDTILKNKPKR